MVELHTVKGQIDASFVSIRKQKGWFVFIGSVTYKWLHNKQVFPETNIPIIY